MFNVLLSRLLATQPGTAAEFNTDLQGLVISAYDLTIDSNDLVHGGVLLGTAEGVVPLQTFTDPTKGIFTDPLTFRLDSQRTRSFEVYPRVDVRS
jgi:hypothetical protein